MSKLSTEQVAKLLGIGKSTLSRHILAGKIPAPKEIMAGGMRMRLWSEKDIQRLLEALPKIANGRKTRWERQRSEHSALGIQHSTNAKSEPKPKPKSSSRRRKAGGSKP